MKQLEFKCKYALSCFANFTDMNMERRRIILGMQSAYYLLAGLWPLVHTLSFMEVTGNSTDVLLIRTVGILLICAAITFFIDLYFQENSSAVVFLSTSCAIGLLFIDIYHSLTAKISIIYLIDAIFQLILIESWLIFFGRRQSETTDW